MGLPEKKWRGESDEGEGAGANACALKGKKGREGM
jgi:hypothetical protein